MRRSLVASSFAPRGRVTGALWRSGSFERDESIRDANGERTLVERWINANDNATDETDSYTLSPGTNRLSGISSDAGTRSITYDARGNTVSESRPNADSITAVYDGHGRLTSYAQNSTSGSTTSLTHVYNGMDERVVVASMVSGGSTTTRRYVYDPDGRVIGEYGSNASDVIAERIWMTPETNDSGMFGGDDGTPESGGAGYSPIAIVAGTTLSWVHANHMGVPELYTDSTGAPIATPAYTLPAFPGQMQMVADLYYNTYRDYDPVTGRYIQADPIGLAGGQSPYSYAMGNPLRYSDPQGLETYWEHYTGLPDSYRKNTIDVIAGVSDSATLGATYYIRHLIGANRDVDRCSVYYDGGEWAGLVLGSARLAYAGGAKIVSATAVDGVAANAFRNASKRFWRGPFAGSNYRVYPYDVMLKKYGSDNAVKAAAGRTNLGYNALGASAAGGSAMGLLENGCICK